ncbi:MAG: hypothetical protein Alis3KO_05030 [Aliiglaciecola sp.]|uniref:DUF5908 family protein n=1 Tax=Aliiglaciecola sp. M165 TaxID=2593649 RepID=UPI00163D8946|nr:DUF5908 family protein [Aliiglaciecola sp. M165]
MPIEIKELVIRATVGEQQGNKANAAPKAADKEAMKQEIIAECVEQVMDILRRKQER